MAKRSLSPEPANKKRVKVTDEISEAKAALQRSSTPAELLGRTTERDKVNSFISNHLEAQTPGALYVYGKPGTGKTLVVEHALTALPDSQTKVVLNCTVVSKNLYTSVFSALLHELGVTKADEQKAYSQFRELLFREEPPIIIVLDEIDQLEPKDTLNQIFELALHEKSRLILIGIANTLDLIGFLPRLGTRRESPEQLPFPSFSDAELTEIVTQRLAGFKTKIFDPSAIEFAAKKIALESGDARKALDACRLALQKAQSQVREDTDQVRVTIMDVQYVLRVLGDPMTSKADRLQTHAKIILWVIVQEKKKKDKKGVTVGQVFKGYSAFCRPKLTPVSDSEFKDICTVLETNGLIKVHPAKEPSLKKVTIQFENTDDILLILTKDSVLFMLTNKR